MARSRSPASEPGLWPRAILHVDMDAFYVAVEVRKDPSLANKPVVVGGAGRRGVVASASYEARAYGVRSAMPGARARRLCPQAIFLPGDHAAYADASAALMDIFRRFTPLVEPLSLDEAFLDVTGAQRRVGLPPVIGAAVRAAVAGEEHLACSVGVAPNKFLAKLASEAAKPRATPSGPAPGAQVLVVEPGQEFAFLHPLPLRALWGVGPATLSRLERLGVSTVGELAALPVAAVVGAVGNAAGHHLHELANGHDDRPVEADRTVKSIGHEETFPFDRSDRAGLEVELVRLSDGVASRARQAGLAGRTVNLKLRYGDFTTLTRAKTLPAATDDAGAIQRAARGLLDSLDLHAGVRLIGVSLSGLAPLDGHQLQLAFATIDRPAVSNAAPPEAAARAAPDRADANRAVDAIRSRFGAKAIGPAALASADGLRVLRRGERQWGPEDGRPAPSVAPDTPGVADPDRASSSPKVRK